MVTRGMWDVGAVLRPQTEMCWLNHMVRGSYTASQDTSTSVDNVVSGLDFNLFPNNKTGRRSNIFRESLGAGRWSPDRSRTTLERGMRSITGYNQRNDQGLKIALVGLMSWRSLLTDFDIWAHQPPSSTLLNSEPSTSISGQQEEDYRPSDYFVGWYKLNHLPLNLSETKELIAELSLLWPLYPSRKPFTPINTSECTWMTVIGGVELDSVDSGDSDAEEDAFQVSKHPELHNMVVEKRYHLSYNYEYINLHTYCDLHKCMPWPRST